MNSVSKPKLLFYLGAIFLAGGVTGAAVALKANKQIAETPRPIQGRLESRYLKDRFQAKLGLTPEQSVKIEPLLDKMSEDLKSVHQDCTKRISMIMKGSYDQIGKELNPEQRKKLEAMQREHRDDRREPSRKRFKSWPESARKSNSPPANL